MNYLFIIALSLVISSLNAQVIDEEEFPYILPISVERIDVTSNTKSTINNKDEISNKAKNFSNTNKNEIDKNVKSTYTTVLEIKFKSSKHTILPESLPKLQEFAELLMEDKGSQVIIYGYTDNTGSDNKRLSQNRAKAVMNALISYGIKLTRLTAIGMGSKNPIASNETPEGRAKNRRIEVELL